LRRDGQKYFWVYCNIQLAKIGGLIMNKTIKGIFFVLMLFVLNLNGFTQTVEGAYFSFDDISSSWIVAIMSGTIFDVFTKDLEDSDYNTDLKKRVFLQSDESKIYLQRLEDLKNTVRTQGVKSLITKQETSLSDYDLQNNGFWLYIGANNGSGTLSGSFKFSINGFLYKKLSVREEPIDFFGAKIC
jgi:hypothetical protein